MGQKVNPIGFRLGLTEPHKSQWFARFSKYKYSQSVLEDYMLRKTLKSTLNNLFLEPLYSASNNNKPTRQDYHSDLPVINNITIERKFIPYQVIITIHAQNCYLFKYKLNDLKVNRELIAKMLKVRAFRFDLRNKINNLKVVYKKDQDPVFQNKKVDIRERRLKKRQKIRFIYRQRIAKDFVITKKGNTIIQELNLRQKTKKRIYLPIQYNYNSFRNKSARLIAIKKAHSLKKQRKTWFNTFPGQTLTPYPKGTKVLKMQVKNKNYFLKNKKYFNYSNKSKKKYLVGLSLGFAQAYSPSKAEVSQILKMPTQLKNSSKNIINLRLCRVFKKSGLTYKLQLSPPPFKKSGPQAKFKNNKTSFLKDPMFHKSKTLFQSRLFRNQKKTIKVKNSFGLRIKKKFVRIFLNKISGKFTTELKENYQDWYNEMVKNTKLSPFTFLKKWRFGQSPVFLTLLSTLKTISKKKQFSLEGDSIGEVLTLLKKIQNYFLPLRKVLSTLKKKIRFKFLALRKEFIAFGTISKVNRFAFYQVLYYFNYLNKLVNELTKIHQRQLAIYKFDMDNNINDDIINLFSPFFKTNKHSITPPGGGPGSAGSPLFSGTNLVDKVPGLLKPRKQSSKAVSSNLAPPLWASHTSNIAPPLWASQTSNIYVDLSDGNLVAKLKKNVPSKVRITRLTRRMKLVEYIRDIIKKHRTTNLYFYLPIISEARQKILQHNLFIKRKSTEFLGSEVNSLIKENMVAKKEGSTKGSALEKQITPHVKKILRKTWNLKIEENKETAYLLRLRSILKEQQRLRKTVELKSKVRIIFFNINRKTMETKASVVCDTIVSSLEKREPFRKAIKKAQRDVMNAKGNIKGIKIQVAGRLNGAEMARTEWVKAGRVPLQSLSSNIDYSYRTASTIYGIIGIKVWIFKGYQKALGYKKVKN
jgi:ribosomal protein S3